MRLSNLRAAVLAFAALFSLYVPAAAQTVTTRPLFVAPATTLDLGNGPQEFQIITGQMGIATSSGSGVGSTSGSSTSLTLTAVPTTAPCVGCIISGTGITSGTTVSAYAVTSITLSAAMTVASSTALAWGAACPTTPGVQALAQAGVGNALPFYTQARICAYGNSGPGGQVLPFAIGAH